MTIDEKRLLALADLVARSEADAEVPVGPMGTLARAVQVLLPLKTALDRAAAAEARGHPTSLLGSGEISDAWCCGLGSTRFRERRDREGAYNPACTKLPRRCRAMSDLTENAASSGGEGCSRPLDLDVFERWLNEPHLARAAEVMVDKAMVLRFVAEVRRLQRECKILEQERDEAEGECEDAVASYHELRAERDKLKAELVTAHKVIDGDSRWMATLSETRAERDKLKAVAEAVLACLLVEDSTGQRVYLILEADPIVVALRAAGLLEEPRRD